MANGPEPDPVPTAQGSMEPAPRPSSGEAGPPAAAEASRVLRVGQAQFDTQHSEPPRAHQPPDLTREKYFDLFERAPIPMLAHADDGTVLAVNRNWTELTGYRLADIPTTAAWVEKACGKHGADASEDVAAWFAFDDRSIARDVSVRCTDGSQRFWAVTSTSLGRLPDGRRIAIAAAHDITIRKQAEATQEFLLECGLQRTGRGFFEPLARHLAETLRMDYVCIDRLVGDGLSAQTVAVYCDGSFQDNVTYALKDTPCGDVVGKAICCFPAGVRHLFPRDAALQDLGGESYLGTTLWSYSGKPIGLIAVIGRKPLTDPARAEALLSLVALRAAGEMERLGAEETTNRLLMSTSSLTGEAFFETLVRELSRWTSMRWTFVSEIDSAGSGTAIPLAFSDRGHLSSRPPYRLEGTPCKVAITNGYYFLGDRLSEQHLDHLGIGECASVSYVGVSLCGIGRVPIGVLGSLHDQPLEAMAPKAREILAMFGHRAAAELVRLRAERELQRRARDLEVFNEALMGREARIIELKNEVNRLSAQLDREPPYPPVWEAE